jgi:hypothetical protein
VVLTPEQKLYYETFGFLVMRQYFSPAETAEICRLFDEVMTEARHGKPIKAEQRQGMLSLIEQRPELSKLIEDDRIHNVAEELLGPDFIWIAGDGNLYVGNTSWHSDLAGRLPSYPVMKIALYLDPVRVDSGCLRVVPGSHRAPLNSSMKAVYRHREDPPVYPFGVTAEHVPFYPLESDPGDVVFFSQELYHSSWGGGYHRRMFTMNFSSRATTTEHEAFHRTLYEGHLNSQRNNSFYSIDRVYNPEFLKGGGPRRRRMVRQLIEWGFR